MPMVRINRCSQQCHSCDGIEYQVHILPSNVVKHCDDGDLHVFSHNSCLLQELLVLTNFPMSFTSMSFP